MKESTGVAGERGRQLMRRQGIAGAAYIIISALVFGVWIWGADTVGTSLNGDRRSTVSRLIEGTADRPFVYRALIPVMTRTLAAAVPANVRDGLIAGATGSVMFQKESKRLGWEVDYLPEYCIALALVYGTLLAFPFVLRSLFVHLYKTEKYVSNLVPVVVLLGLPPFFHVGTHYLYDFPALTLFTLAVLLLVKKRWLLFYLVYGIGCVNKETMVFASVAFVLLYAKEAPPRWTSFHFLLQMSMFAVVKGFLNYTYATNAGGPVEFHLYGNLHQLLFPYTLVQILLLAIIAAFVYHDFDRKPLLLQKTAWLLIPFVVLMLFFGCVAEFRVLYEIYPIFALLIVHTVFFSLLKVPYALREGEA